MPPTQCDCRQDAHPSELLNYTYHGRLPTIDRPSSFGSCPSTPLAFAPRPKHWRPQFWLRRGCATLEFVDAGDDDIAKSLRQVHISPLTIRGLASATTWTTFRNRVGSMEDTRRPLVPGALGRRPHERFVVLCRRCELSTGLRKFPIQTHLKPFRLPSTETPTRTTP